MGSDRPAVRYAICWKRLPQTLALAAATAIWLGFLLHGA
jgi:hypothetical protein